MQFGNSVPVSIVEKVAEKMLKHIELYEEKGQKKQVTEAINNTDLRVSVEFPRSLQASLNL